MILCFSGGKYRETQYDLQKKSVAKTLQKRCVWGFSRKKSLIFLSSHEIKPF